MCALNTKGWMYSSNGTTTAMQGSTYTTKVNLSQYHSNLAVCNAWINHNLQQGWEAHIMF